MHQAVWIDAQRDVVDRFAAMNRFGNHQLLVLGPGELRGNPLRGPFLLGLSWRVPKRTDQNAEVFGRRGLDIALVSREHCRKAVGSFENDSRKLPAALLTNLWRQDIFQLVGKFAELVVAASSRIAF